MSTVTVASETGSASGLASWMAGSVRVRERVLEKVVREVSAVTIGVPRGDVETDVSEWGGGLAVRVAAKLPVPDLSDTEAIMAAPPVIERIRTLQVALADEFGRLTGRQIRRVSFTVTGAAIAERKRVR